MDVPAHVSESVKIMNVSISFSLACAYSIGSAQSVPPNGRSDTAVDRVVQPLPRGDRERREAVLAEVPLSVSAGLPATRPV